MDRLSKAFSLSQNSSSSSNKNSKKNKEIMNSEKIEKFLQDWKLPPSSASDVFKRKSIFNYSADYIIKTVEEEIPLSEEYTTVPLFSDVLKRAYSNKYTYLHIGMIQVGLKATKLGSNASAIISLRDKRFLKFDESVLGMVEASLCDGPIYFSYFPTHCVCMSDPHLSSTFTIDTKTEGSSRDENLILMYRFHYKVMETYNLDSKNLSRNLVDGMRETTLSLTNVAQSNRVVSKKISWDEVAVPEIWMVRNNLPSSAVKQGAVVANARMEWKETAEAHVLKVDVPAGLKKEEVKVEVEDGRILVISGVRRRELEEKSNILEEVKAAIERSSGKFLSRLRLPETAKAEQVKAAMENGVLTVTVPKEEVKKKVEVMVIDISG